MYTLKSNLSYLVYLSLKMKKYPVQIAIICLLAWLIPSAGWLQERNGPFDIGTRQLKLLPDSGRFRLQITEGDTLSQLSIPPGWLIPKENEEKGYVSSFNYDEALTAFRIGLSKSPVDFIKEVYLRKNICVLDYKNFGVQAMAHELLGFQWYQWNNHGDPDPNATYDIKVVVYNNILPGKVKELYPVVSALEQDFRYVEYSRAVQYFDRQIQQIDELGQTELRQENMSMFENLRSTLIKTREEIVNKLNN